ncbi:MAG: sporulation protein YqfD [Epulopiscium sp.]|nr:sporulation protein YqfD [Candidatus Epulonipiscium sp.]
MLISIWNYLRGYVMIEVSGFSVERFLNLVAHRDIYIWDIERQGNKLSMKISIEGYKMLKPCARKTGCKVRIKDKRGLPFIKHKYRKRKMIPIGMVIFIALIYMISSFVWLIEIEGNKKIDSQEIVDRLDQDGYKIGGLKKKMDLREAEQMLMRDFPDVLWTGISFEGTKLIVKITEVVPEPKLIDYNSPTDIVANSDALILDIVTRKGTPMVRKGDTVRKGDILVSGEIPLADEWDEESKVSYTRSSADILAKTHYTVETQIPLKKNVKKYTGAIKKKYSIRIIDKEIKLHNSKIDFRNYDYTIKSRQLQATSKFPLPFYIVLKEYIEYIPKSQIISDELAQDTLRVMLHDLLAEETHINAEIIKQEVKFNKKGGIMGGRLQAIVKEELGEEKSIIINDGRNKVNDNEQSEH